jgi:hypothetical protein
VVTTFEALLVAVIAVLPGAVYTIARESHGASWAGRKTDAATRIFRFVANLASASSPCWLDDVQRETGH